MNGIVLNEVLPKDVTGYSHVSKRMMLSWLIVRKGFTESKVKGCHQTYCKDRSWLHPEVEAQRPHHLVRSVVVATSSSWPYSTHHKTWQ